MLEGLSSDTLVNFDCQLTDTQRLIAILAIPAACLIVYLVFRKLIFPAIRHFTLKTSITWDDHLLNDRVVKFASILLPVLTAYIFLPLLLSSQPFTFSVVNKLCLVLIIAISVQLVNAFISSFQIIASETESLKRRPLQGLYQTAKIIVIAIGCILAVSVLLDKEPSVVLTGLGASAAIMMLVFKDSIMGLVAGVQINVYDMVRPGDWIIMEKHGANGTVTEVTLNIVKVRNWDNTIITIPTYALVSDSFQNWRGMQDSGKRRIKEPVLIDAQSVRFCNAGEAAAYASLIPELPIPEQPVTNLYFYRHYVEHLLRNHPNISPTPQLMARLLPATPHGIPLEIYTFSARTEWVVYEHIKSGIMETAYASLTKFGLRLYQAPTGHDLQSLKNTTDKQ